MIPLETLSALRDKEVYRMPSVSSMFILLDKCNNKKKQVESNLTPFPSIDPLCGYFLLNPDGTLNRYERTFKDHFEEKKLQVLYMFKLDKNSREEPLDV
jgi:separase